MVPVEDTLYPRVTKIVVITEVLAKTVVLAIVLAESDQT
jgi:hypothetical protein